MKTFLKTIVVIAWTLICIWGIFECNVKSEYFEDNSGRIVITYCVPFGICED